MINLRSLRKHKTLASVTAIAVLAGVPLTIAAFHKGFPVSDVDLDAQDVWVTNASDLLGGRLNHQIGELDASVNGSSSDLDVLQNGSAYFLTDTKNGTLQRIDPAYVSLTDQVTIPRGSWVGYGGDTIAILAPDGRLWSVDAADRLSFDASKTKPVAKLGTKAVASVSTSGVTFAVSPSKNTLYTVKHPGADATTTKLAVDTDAQLSAVGDTPVILDKGGQRLRTPDKTLALPAAGLQLQQPSAASSNVLVSASDRLYRVPLDGGDATTIKAGGTTPDSVSDSDVSAPVQLKGCDYAAWASSARYLYACEGAKPISTQIQQPVSGADLRFRVNHNVIALNNLQNGDAWIVSSNMKLVRNWQMLEPSKTEKKQSDKGQEQPVMQSYQAAVANRTKNNQQPDAVDDSFGVRPGRTTILPVLDNDTDPDGDVLTVQKFDQIPKSLGTIDAVDGGRSLQFTPAPSVTGGAAFRYTVTDGRGGVDTATVQLRVHEPSENAAPASTRASTVDVEAGQSISYNVLQDWLDPDGDSIYLVSATPTTQDSVSFTPDGGITFANTSNQVGTKEVNFTVSDGQKQAQGKLEVNVKQQGSTKPVAVSDFADVTLGRTTTIEPLKNDESPSGDTLGLADATSTDEAVQVQVHQDQGTISVLGRATGTYYLTYTASAGTKDAQGIIRVDVTDPEDKSAPPLAVNDVAYVHPGQSTTVTPLDNDVSPSGRVLAIQSVTAEDSAADALNIQLLDNTVVKITSPGVLQKQVQLKYVVSDGLKSATGAITVVPVAPLVNYQPPVAVNDAVNVRAGDISTVDVLDNDYSPDDQPFTLDPVLKSAPTAGTAFVSGDTVRFQAPDKAGVYSLSYQISDEHQQHAVAQVQFNVIPADKSNQAPDPQTITARAFADSAIPITVPLNGIDPDGDSVFLDGITDEPQLGKVTGTNATGFVYQPAASSAGTDEFHYQVEDTAGKTATGLIRIAVIPRPSSLQPPTAVNDRVEVKPGKTASVQVLDNDSDPNGYPLALTRKLTDIDDGLTHVSVDGKAVLFTAPQKEGAYTLRYTVDNEHGGTASAYVQVIVSKDAPPRYPTAEDHYVSAQKTKGKTAVNVDALDGATNPSGPVADLTVQTTGPNAKLATVGKDGQVAVQAQDKRTVIAYQVTDPDTKLTGKAFIIVPPAKVKTTKPETNSDQNVSHKTTNAPQLKPGLPEQVVEMNGSKTFSFGDILDVPSGRPAKLAGRPTADHGTVTGSGTSFTFTPSKDYRGPATITFQVDDGKEDGASSDRITQLALPVTVGSKDQSDVPPTFTPQNIKIEPGETATKVDLRSASYHPNPQILASLKYDKLNSTDAGGVKATLSGSTLTVSAPVDQKPNTTADFTFDVSSAKYTITGTVHVTVTSSTRPIAEQKNPPQKAETQRGHAATISNAVGSDQWVNPFPDTPLKITDATLASAPKGVTVSHTDNSITVTPSSGADIGTVNVTYHVEDATKDPTRTAQAIGRLQVTIHDKPATPAAPSGVTADDGQATMTIHDTTANGKTVTAWQIESNQSAGPWTAKVGTNTVKPLTNGTAYKFRVRAKNDDGWSDWSEWSKSVTPYGTPSKPTGLTIKSTNGSEAPSKFRLSWSPPNSTGGGSDLTYQWKFKTNTGTTSALSHTTAQQPAGTYSFSVRVKNNHSGAWSGWADSGSVTTKDPPPTVTLTKGAETGVIHNQYGDCNDPGTCYYYHVTVAHFPANSSQTIHFYCNGSENGSTRTMSVDGNGNGTYDTSTDPKKWCGFNPASVTVGGHSSGNKDFTAGG